MKHLISGQKKLVFRQRESQDFTVILRRENVITSGSMVLALVVHVQRSIMIVEKNTAAVNRTVKWDVTVTVLWKYGITYLPSLRETEKVVTPNFPRRISILVWD